MVFQVTKDGDVVDVTTAKRGVLEIQIQAILDSKVFDVLAMQIGTRVLETGRRDVPFTTVVVVRRAPVDEWYKAAFHQNGGDTGNYFTSAYGDPCSICARPLGTGFLFGRRSTRPSHFHCKRCATGLVTCPAGRRCLLGRPRSPNVLRAFSANFSNRRTSRGAALARSVVSPGSVITS